MITAGIDIGSITTKAAIFADGKITATKVIFTGYNAEAAGLKVYEEALKEAGIDKKCRGKNVSTATAATALNSLISPTRKSCATPPEHIF
jgi:activator of 2-hydroxyglutaryl-CoA dehydratase